MYGLCCSAHAFLDRPGVACASAAGKAKKFSFLENILKKAVFLIKKWLQLRNVRWNRHYYFLFRELPNCHKNPFLNAGVSKIRGALPSLGKRRGLYNDWNKYSALII
jgi:hypothetical protein